MLFYSVCVCIKEREYILHSVLSLSQINREPVLDPSLFLRSLGKETLGGGFYMVSVHQLPPQISCACHFLYSQILCWPGRLRCCHGCAVWRVPLGAGILVTVASLHCIFSSVSVADWASMKLTDSRVAAYVESSLHPTSPFQLFLSHENFFFFS